MNKTMKYMKNIRLFGLLLMLPLAFASCTDVWNGHYDVDNQKQIADKIHRLENLTIPEGYDFDKVSGLSIECRQKLVKYAPRTIGQASRISGVSPSDVSVLLMYFGR